MYAPRQALEKNQYTFFTISNSRFSAGEAGWGSVKSRKSLSYKRMNVPQIYL